MNSAMSGIEFQTGTFTNIQINNITLVNIGSNGITLYNENSNNSAITISNVIVRDFGIKYSESSAIDLRGPISICSISISSPTSLLDGKYPIGIFIHGNDPDSRSTIANVHVEYLDKFLVVEPGDTQLCVSNALARNCKIGFQIEGNNCKFCNCSILIDAGQVGDGYNLTNCTNCAFVNCYYMNMNYVSMDTSSAWTFTDGSDCFLCNCDVVNGYYGFRRVAGDGGHVLQNCRTKGTGIPFSPGTGTDSLLNCAMSTTNGNKIGQVGNEFKVEVLDTAGDIRLKSKNGVVVDSPKMVLSNSQVLSTTAGSLSGQYLTLNVNNIDYKIQLYNTT